MKTITTTTKTITIRESKFDPFPSHSNAMHLFFHAPSAIDTVNTKMPSAKLFGTNNNKKKKRVDKGWPGKCSFLSAA